jgi:iron complex transport system substrate-binding protein
MSVEPTTLAGVLRSILDVGQATGTRDRAEELVRGLWARVDAVRGAVAGRERPRVACLEWVDPLMAGGHWVPDQVAVAGGMDVLGVSGERSRRLSADELRAAAPEVLLCMPCGYRLQGAGEQLAILRSQPFWNDLPAVSAGQVYALDGSWYFNRPGPRVIDGLEILAKILHPDAWRGPVPQGFQRVD